jgi:hypothetical protein
MQLSAVDKLSLSLFTLVVGALLRRFLMRSRSTPLKGPPRLSWLTGAVGFEFTIAGRTAAIKEWTADYGPVFQIPWAMGSNQVVLCDPKAVAHFYAGDSTVYLGSKATRKVTELLVRRISLSRATCLMLRILQMGRGIFWAEKDDHRRYASGCWV